MLSIIAAVASNMWVIIEILWSPIIFLSMVYNAVKTIILIGARSLKRNFKTFIDFLAHCAIEVILFAPRYVFKCVKLRWENFMKFCLDLMWTTFVSSCPALLPALYSRLCCLLSPFSEMPDDCFKWSDPSFIVGALPLTWRERIIVEELKQRMHLRHHDNLEKGLEKGYNTGLSKQLHGRSAWRTNKEAHILWLAKKEKLAERKLAKQELANKKRKLAEEELELLVVLASKQEKLLVLAKLDLAKQQSVKLELGAKQGWLAKQGLAKQGWLLAKLGLAY